MRFLQLDLVKVGEDKDGSAGLAPCKVAVPSGTRVTGACKPSNLVFSSLTTGSIPMRKICETWVNWSGVNKGPCWVGLPGILRTWGPPSTPGLDWPWLVSKFGWARRCNSSPCPVCCGPSGAVAKCDCKGFQHGSSESPSRSAEGPSDEIGPLLKLKWNNLATERG